MHTGQCSYILSCDLQVNVIQGHGHFSVWIVQGYGHFLQTIKLGLISHTWSHSLKCHFLKSQTT